MNAAQPAAPTPNESSAQKTAPPSGNAFVAARLRQAGDLLAAQQDNPFRAAAYRLAADVVAALERDVRDIFDEGGAAALERIPRVGPSIAAAIAELATTGRWSYLERLRGAADPQDRFRHIPGVGPKLAQRLHEELGVETLEQLEAALADPRAKAPKGIGERRRAMIRSGLDALLSRLRPRAGRAQDEPDVGLLLDVDREYCEKAAGGLLPTIAPRRFNPSGQAWLPVLHAQRGPWRFTALHSNTARAHELGKARDWTVIYFSADDGAEAQRTVVTETRGTLAGKRVVRGREGACLAYYARNDAPAA